MLAFIGMRQQTGIDDRQFLLIPHHSGALLMCREANLRDPEILSLCEGFVRSQRQKIAQMRQLLKRR